VATGAAALPAGTSISHDAFIRHLRDLVAGVPAAATAVPAPAATELEAAAAARGGRRRP